jgi:GH35 family endo-1,4-beta-xylanase
MTSRVNRFSGAAMTLLVTAVIGWCVNPVEGAPLTAEEIQQIESEFGITLTTQEKADLAAVVKPDAPHPQWRIDANARVELHRKADLDVQVVDSVGTPVPGAQVDVHLSRNAFAFGGTFSARDFYDDFGNLNMSTDDYKDRLLSMFNGVGLNNGFKPKLTGIHSFLPGVMSWAQANGLPIRGHLLIWPGGTHLSTASTSAYASYNVQGAVDTYNNNGQQESDKIALKVEVDAEIAEWAGYWNVYEWDVINETLNNHVLQDILGDDQMAEWFEIAEANQVDPECRLLINEYQIISAMSESRTPGWYTNRRDRYMANIDLLIASNAPLDRIGFQSRIKHERRDPQLIYDRLEEWGNAYGLEMVGTEFEVIDSDPGAWKEYIYTAEERAEITEEMMTQYYSHPLVTGFNAWNTINDDTEALIDYSGRPTLHGLVWYYVHRIRYMTATNGTTDVLGSVAARAYKGDYDITVSYNGSDYPASLSLASNQTAVVVLDDVLVDPGPVPVPIWVALEEWTYDGVADGTALNGTGTESTTGTGSKWADKAPFGVVSNQMQRWEATGTDNESGFHDFNHPSYADATTGKYQLSYDVVSADFSNTDAFGGRAQFGYGIRDAALTGGDRNGVLLVRYVDTGGENKIHLRTLAGSTVDQDIVGSHTVSDLHVRAVYDLDSVGSAGSFIGYFSVGGGPETAVTNALAPGFTLRTLRMHIQALNGGNSWQPGDTVMIDNIVFSEEQLVVTPESYYAFWLSEYPGIGSATNLTDNPDFDAADNLQEYAFGGDPTNGLDVGRWPEYALVDAGGTNWLEAVHYERSDAAERGLAYTVEQTDDLKDGSWTNAGIAFVGVGDVDADFKAVTNRLPAVDSEGFIRVRTSYTP